jgi:murein DD-endopeptidase MepM/ murein hydrolase activator NlpD
MGWDLRTHAPGHRSAGHEGGGLATFRRFIEDDLTVIVLSNGTANRFNPDQIAEGIAGLVVPEIRSAAAHLTDRMKLAIIDQGIEEALRLYRDFIADRLPGDEPTEREMNSLGYDLLHLGRPEQAIEILKSNIERYPESSNAHDSLGEAFLEAGNRDRARTHYRRSLDLDSSNDNAIRVLETLAGYVLPYPAGERFLLLQGNNGPWGHTGAAAYAFDFKMTIGTPVTAARGGQVVALEKSFKDGNRIPGQENFVVVRHGDGTYGRYYHLTSNGVQVSVGQEVLQGAEIGWSGDTGASAGPHLHFDVTTDCFEWGCQTIEIAFGKTDTPKLTQGQSYEAQ